MTQSLRLILLIVAIIAIAVPRTQAASSKDDSLRDTFKRLDKNSDGALSKQEFVAKMTGDKRIAAERRFSQLDQNKNKQLSLQEYMAQTGSAKSKKPAVKTNSKKKSKKIK